MVFKYLVVSPAEENSEEEREKAETAADDAGDHAEVLLQVQQDDPVLRLGGLEVLHILATWVRGIVSLLPSILIFISVSICF